MPRRAVGKVLAEVRTQHVDHVACRLLGDEQRDVGALAHCHQLLGRRLVVGRDHHRRLQGHDARDAPGLVFRRHLRQVTHFAPPDDLYAVGVDVVEVADQIGGRLRVADGDFIETAFRVGVARQPLPVQDRSQSFKQRLGADDGGLQGAACRAAAGQARRWPMLTRPTSRVPSWRSAHAAPPHRVRP